eukprot:TRINITY_DN2814_c0_g1_i1.p1 TRINITY_DN2814_c0_g1~~TRINITY_DN2814_c0_g1_i1.p1  ORF type:complete len:221 (+),score=71.38 TRINITY_DN2814_c0_g1_i1:486-1148(+)
MSSRDIVGEINELLKSGASQEKLARLLQYFCKFLKWYYLTNNNKNEANRMINLSNAMGMTRKVLRFPKTLEQYVGIRNSFPLNPPTTVPDLIKFLQLISKFWLVGYFFFDHFIWMHRVNVIVLSPETMKRLQGYSDISWVGEVSTNLITLIIERSYKGDNMNEEDRAKSNRNLLRNALDLPVAVHFWKPDLVAAVPEGVFGVLGAATSSISLYDMWPKKK